MNQAYAVIGAQYGDEGKGLMVDFLADRLGGSRVVVVRSNGGSQAGHTVVTADGDRHVFQHFGSGSFTGARTHLSRFMICNPIRFREERSKLLDKGVRPPRVSVDPSAMVTLPFDALVNQAVESFRGNTRHGSCGHGIGETVERNEHDDGFPVCVSDLADMTLDELRNIRDSWVPKRLKALAVSYVTPEYLDLLNSDDILVGFLNDAAAFLRLVEIVPDEELTRLGQVVFEAAQGLALDAEMGAFPYVTRSNTGMKNIAEICRLAGIERVETFYMTRIYTSRHGAGPLAREGEPTGVYVSDPTNVPNDWQGALRIAPLDINFLRDNITRDLTSVDHSRLAITPHIVVTHLDQITSDKATVYFGGVEQRLDPIQVKTSFGKWGFDLVHESYGPTRADVALDEALKLRELEAA